MSSDRDGQVITFYSYKGGVGRSMAVANVAALLAYQGRRVLVLDFDFEAPGLHRYFLTHDSDLGEKRFAPAELQQGMIDFFHALRRDLDSALATVSPGGPPKGACMKEVAQRVWDAGGYVYTVRLNNPNLRDAGHAEIDFVAAGRFDERYPDRVHSFDWQHFYGDYPEIFPIVAAEWTRRYDHVLIDSRTGVTDIGSICTMLLPEKLVLVFSPNNQSLEGALQVGEQAVRQRIASPDLRPLPLFPLLSRLENAEDELKRLWIARARGGFERIFRSAYDLSECDLTAYFDKVRVPHASYYAYDEKIAAEREAATESQSLASVFAEFIECLEGDNPNEVQTSSPWTHPPVDALPPPASPVEVYLSYAHRDRSLAEELLAHLFPLQKQGFIHVWHQGLMALSEEREEGILRHLDGAQILVLLISADYLASHFTFDLELPRALAMLDRGRAILLPVILRPVDWTNTPLGGLQPLPAAGKPVTRWRDRDEAWNAVILEIREALAGVAQS